MIAFDVISAMASKAAGSKRGLQNFGKRIAIVRIQSRREQSGRDQEAPSCANIASPNHVPILTSIGRRNLLQS